MFLRTCASSALIVVCGLAMGSAPESLRASRLEKAPVIDGTINEDEWKGSAQTPDFIDPFRGTPYGDRSIAYLAYDEKAIYVAFKCFAADPTQLVGRDIQRGSTFPGEDTVSFAINPLGNHSFSGQSTFTVNLLNTQRERIAGGRAGKQEWTGKWRSAVRRTETGFEVEMAIPWGILNYPNGKDRVMDVLFTRNHGKQLTSSNWPNLTLQGLPELQARWEGVTPPAGAIPTKFRGLAYTVPEYANGQFKLQSGLDLRYQFNPQLTGIAAINPDFRNIESQIAGNEFTRTERFIGDVRPFFTEGQGFFNLTGQFGLGRMFYSQRIGAFDYGAKAFGQLNPTLNIGALVAVDGKNEVEGVFRLAKIFDPRTSATFFATATKTPEVKDSTAGGTFNMRRGNYQFYMEGATLSRENRRPLTAFSANISYQIPKVYSGVFYTRVPVGFNPSLAFIPWTDRRGGFWYTEYNTEYRTGTLRSFGGNFSISNFTTWKGDPQEVGTFFNIYGRTKSDIRFGINKDNTRYFGRLDNVWGANLDFNASNRFRQFGIYAETGTRNGGTKTSYVAAKGSFRLWKRLDLGISYSVLNFEGSNRQGIYTLAYEFSPVRAISARVITIDGKPNAYFAIRNGGLSGFEWYFIYGDPNGIRSSNRIALKLVYPF